jgi:hypothetical protein
MALITTILLAEARNCSPKLAMITSKTGENLVLPVERRAIEKKLG